ncbi:hypothetical protein [Actinomadura sp. 9N215]|uniref:hypothetical protein n=1 Tax=Actinomadura sp. 9N215 TaxID=3375150 RepID=UPI0037A9E7EB
MSAGGEGAAASAAGADSDVSAAVASAVDAVVAFSGSVSVACAVDSGADDSWSVAVVGRRGGRPAAVIVRPG